MRILLQPRLHYLRKPCEPCAVERRSISQQTMTWIVTISGAIAIVTVASKPAAFWTFRIMQELQNTQRQNQGCVH